MDLPLVSVITCIHNRENFILDAIDSALNQNYPHESLWHVLIDDCSTDNTVDKIKEKLFKDSEYATKTEDFGVVSTIDKDKIKFILIELNENGGPSRARNIGMRYVWEPTDVFSILDSDDVYYPDKVSRSIVKMMEDPVNISVVYADYDIVNEQGNQTAEFKKIYDRQDLLRESIVHSNSLINKRHLSQVLENGQIYDEQLRTAEDFDLFLRLSDLSIPIHIAESLMSVRVGPHDSTNSVQKEIWQQNYHRVMQKLRFRENG